MAGKIEMVFDRVAALLEPSAIGFVSHEQQTTAGRVIGVGPTCKSGVNNGDLVVFGKYTGSEIMFNDKRVIILREDEILCVVHDG